VDQKRYLVLPEFNAVELYAGQCRYASDVEAYPFTLQDLKRFEQGINIMYPSLSMTDSLFSEYLGYSDEDCEFWVGESVGGILSGQASTDIITEIQDEIDCQASSFRFYLWDAVMTGCMDTGLPMLKGYSRRKLAQRKKMPIWWYQLFDEEKMVETVQKDTPIYFLPREIQCRLYQAMEIKDTKKAMLEIEVIKKELGVDNYDIRFLIISRYFDEGEFETAAPLVRALKTELGNRDPYLKKIHRVIREAKQEDLFFDEMPSSNVISYKRSTPKIGRNDPCPCGSGKKYKKCCGR
jgi:hypothetical protein